MKSITKELSFYGSVAVVFIMPPAKTTSHVGGKQGTKRRVMAHKDARTIEKTTKASEMESRCVVS